MLKQLDQWGILNGIKNPVRSFLRLYGYLSGDVHVIPDKIDIGRVLLYDQGELFGGRTVIPQVLAEFLDLVHELVDMGLVVTVNLLQDNLQIKAVRKEVGQRLASVEFERPHLSYTRNRLITLLSDPLK